MLKHFNQYRSYINEIDTVNRIENMTYILSGIYNNNPFLMVDCIITSNKPDGTVEYKFTNKLKKLDSVKNTFYAITGNHELSSAINLYDNWLLIDNQTKDLLINNTIINSNSDIYEIIEIFKKLIEKHPEEANIKIQPQQRIFFINDMMIIYYDLTFVDGTINNITKHIISQDNLIIKSVIHSIPTFLKVNGDLYDHCKNKIILWKGSNIFKDRFSFLTFENKIPSIKYPYKDMDDLILDFYAGDYSDLK
jgi:hypothetical protein